MMQKLSEIEDGKSRGRTVVALASKMTAWQVMAFTTDAGRSASGLARWN